MILNGFIHKSENMITMVKIIYCEVVTQITAAFFHIFFSTNISQFFNESTIIFSLL
jgi:hypothetical protein